MIPEDDKEQAVLPHLRTVCRCNNIKFRTIQRAIEQGAATIHEVACRTTATTGYCGGSCTPNVQEMIDAVHAPAPRLIASEEEDAWWAVPLDGSPTKGRS